MSRDDPTQHDQADRHEQLNRRQFLELSAAGALTLSATTALANDDTPTATFEPARYPGRVVKVAHRGAMTDPSDADSSPDEAVVGLMVDTALMALTGRGDIGVAWRQLIHPSDRVMLKVNCIGSPYMASNRAVTEAVIRGLQSMGLPNDQMLVYDQFSSRMRRANYRPGEDILGVAVEHCDDRGYAEEPTPHGAGESRFANAVRAVTAIVNIPVIKDHDDCGLTMCMKNLTHGVIHNPVDMHRGNNPGHTDTSCSIHADLWLTEHIGPKVRVMLADGLRLLYDGGPQNNPSKILHNAVYASTDPVALDTIGSDLVDETRREHGLPSLADDGRPCHWLPVAQDRGIGFHDRDHITFEEHVLS